MDSIWETPELAFSEHQSARTLKLALQSEEFSVEENLAGIGTAFSGRFGSGRPVIGILGEFDALYYSIFWEMPKHPEVRSKTIQFED